MSRSIDPIPVPGKPVRGSRTGKPIMALFDLLGRNWAMGVVWNLGDGAATFRQLQERCESISPTVLNRRLKELQAARCIEKSEQGYILTSEGRQLLDLLIPLGRWSKQWAAGFEAPPVQSTPDSRPASLPPSADTDRSKDEP